MDDYFYSVTIDVHGKRRLGHANVGIRIISYYRPPVGANYGEFLAQVQNRKCLIVGDVNLDILNLPASGAAKACRYVNLLNSFDFQIIHSNVTRSCSGTIIDHVGSICHQNGNVTANTVPVDFSDHSAVFVHLPVEVSEPTRYVEKRVTNNDVFRNEQE